MIDSHTQAVLNRVAQEFSKRIFEIFESEDTLKAAFEERFSQTPFDRTSRWNTILSIELKACWVQYKGEGMGSLTAFDQNQILHAVRGHLDYNLFTQVLLNLQVPLLRYHSGDAESAIEDIRNRWELFEKSPLDPKAKMHKTAATQEEFQFNRDLSRLKALRIVQGLSQARSFRVSPIGSTPALTDSENLSMLGIGGDHYLAVPEGCKAYYFCWDQTPSLVSETKEGSRQFNASGISYRFESKSGGEILNQVLFARMVAERIWAALPEDVAKAVLPRMNSVLLVTNATPDQVAETKDHVNGGFPVIQVHEDRRPELSAA